MPLLSTLVVLRTDLSPHAFPSPAARQFLKDSCAGRIFLDMIRHGIHTDPLRWWTCGSPMQQMVTCGCLLRTACLPPPPPPSVQPIAVLVAVSEW